MVFIWYPPPQNPKPQLNKSQLLQREKPGWKLHMEIFHLLLHFHCIHLLNFHLQIRTETVALV